jgi:hypothetical protein
MADIRKKDTPVFAIKFRGVKGRVKHWAGSPRRFFLLSQPSPARGEGVKNADNVTAWPVALYADERDTAS